jgi:hypothetical protein
MEANHTLRANQLLDRLIGQLWRWGEQPQSTAQLSEITLLVIDIPSHSRSDRSASPFFCAENALAPNQLKRHQDDSRRPFDAPSQGSAKDSSLHA